MKIQSPELMIILKSILSGETRKIPHDSDKNLKPFAEFISLTLYVACPDRRVQNGVVCFEYTRYKKKKKKKENGRTYVMVTGKWMSEFQVRQFVCHYSQCASSKTISLRLVYTIQCPCFLSLTSTHDLEIILLSKQLMKVPRHEVWC